MVTLDWISIVLVTIITFVLGGIWHGPIFGKLWMRIHFGKDECTEKEEKEMSKGMWKIMVAEFIASFLMIMTLDFLMKTLQYSGTHIAFLVWIGFTAPTIVSMVVWWADKREWMMSKILISIGFRLVALLFAGYFLTLWQW